MIPTNILLIIIALILMGVGGWLSVKVAPFVWAFFISGFLSIINIIKGKNNISTALFYFKNSIGVLLIFIIGLALIISGILIIKSRFK